MVDFKKAIRAYVKGGKSRTSVFESIRGFWKGVAERSARMANEAEAKKQDKQRRDKLVEDKTNEIINAYSKGLISEEELTGIVNWVFNGEELPKSLSQQSDEEAVVEDARMLTSYNRLARSLDLATIKGIDNAIIAETTELVPESDLADESGKSINEIIEERRQNNAKIQSEVQKQSEQLANNRKELKTLTDAIITEIKGQFGTSKKDKQAKSESTQVIKNLFVSAGLGGTADQTYADGIATDIPVAPMLEWMQKGMLTSKQIETITNARRRVTEGKGANAQSLKAILTMRESVPAELQGLFDSYVGFTITKTTNENKNGKTKTSYSANLLLDEQKEESKNVITSFTPIFNAVQKASVKSLLTNKTFSLDITQQSIQEMTDKIVTEEMLEEQRQGLISTARTSGHFVTGSKYSAAMSERKTYLVELIRKNKRKVATKEQARIRQNATDEVLTNLEELMQKALSSQYGEAGTIRKEVASLYNLDTTKTAEDLGLTESEYEYYKKIKMEAGGKNSKTKKETAFKIAKHYPDEIKQLIQLEEGVAYSKQQILNSVTNKDGTNIKIEELTSEQHSDLETFIKVHNIYVKQRDLVVASVLAKDEIRQIRKMLIDCKYDALVSIQEEKETQLKNIKKQEDAYRKKYSELKGVSFTNSPESKKEAGEKLSARIDNEQNQAYDIIANQYAEVIKTNKQIITDSSREAYFSIYETQLVADGVKLEDATKIVKSLKNKYKNTKTEDLEATLTTEYISKKSGAEQTTAQIKIEKSMGQYGSTVDKLIAESLKSSTVKTLDELKALIERQETIKSDISNNKTELIQPITIEVYDSTKGKKVSKTFDSRKKLDEYFANERREADKAITYLCGEGKGSATQARETVDLESKKAVEYAKQQHFIKRYEAVSTFIERLTHLQGVYSTSKNGMGEIDNQTKALLEKQGINVGEIINSMETDVNGALAESQEIRTQIIQEAITSGLVPIFETVSKENTPIEGEMPVEEVVASDELAGFMSRDQFEHNVNNFYPIINEQGDVIGYTAEQTTLSTKRVEEINAEKAEQATNASENNVTDAQQSNNPTTSSDNTSENNQPNDKKEDAAKPEPANSAEQTNNFATNSTSAKKPVSNSENVQNAPENTQQDAGKKGATEFNAEDKHAEQANNNGVQTENQPGEVMEMSYDKIFGRQQSIAFLRDKKTSQEDKLQMTKALLGDELFARVSSDPKRAIEAAVAAAKGEALQEIKDLQAKGVSKDVFADGMVGASNRALEERKKNKDKGALPIEDDATIDETATRESANKWYDYAAKPNDTKGNDELIEAEGKDELEEAAIQAVKAAKVTKFGAEAALKRLGKIEGKVAQAALDDALNASLNARPVTPTAGTSM